LEVFERKFSVLRYFDLPSPSIHRHKLQRRNSGAVSGVGCILLRRSLIAVMRVDKQMTSAQLVVTVSLIWQLVSTTEVHSRKYVKGTIYRCIKFGTEISILQFDTIRVALSNQLYGMKINRLEGCQNIHEFHCRILM